MLAELPLLRLVDDVGEERRPGPCLSHQRRRERLSGLARHPTGLHLIGADGVRFDGDQIPTTLRRRGSHDLIRPTRVEQVPLEGVLVLGALLGRVHRIAPRTRKPSKHPRPRPKMRMSQRRRSWSTAIRCSMASISRIRAPQCLTTYARVRAAAAMAPRQRSIRMQTLKPERIATPAIPIMHSTGFPFDKFVEQTPAFRAYQTSIQCHIFTSAPSDSWRR